MNLATEAGEEPFVSPYHSMKSHVLEWTYIMAIAITTLNKKY
jgi:hypothetical protein